MRHTNAVDTIQDDTAPYLRAALYYDETPIDPLGDWDHGIQFKTLPSAGRTWRDYIEPTSNGAGIDFDPEDFAEFAGEWEDYHWCYQCNGTGEQFPAVTCTHCGGKGTTPAGKRNPTLRRYLDTHTAAWCLINRDGYNGGFHTYDPGDIDIDNADAIAYVSREEFRQWHMIPEGKPMPRGYRAKAAEALRAVIDEYNAYATGDVYGIIVEYHDPEACDLLNADYACDPTDPEDNCECWTETEVSCWGFRGYDYARGDAAQEMLSEARAYPEYRPGYEDPEPDIDEYPPQETRYDLFTGTYVPA